MLPNPLYKQVEHDSEHPELVLRSSVAEVKLATDTLFWKDVIALLQQRITKERDDLEVMGADYTREAMAFTQGKICAFREVLDISETFNNIITAVKKEDENGQNT